MSDARIHMLAAAGTRLGWTYDRRQYELVREQVEAAVDALAGDDGTCAFKDTVAWVQRELGTHPAFPSGRMTDAARYVAADLEGRAVLQRTSSRSPVRLRRAEDRPPS